MSRLLRSDAALTGKPHIHTALKDKVTHFFQILPEKAYLCHDSLQILPFLNGR